MIIITLYYRDGFVDEICQLDMSTFLAKTINWYINGILEDGEK